MHPQRVTAFSANTLSFPFFSQRENLIPDVATDLLARTCTTVFTASSLTWMSDKMRSCLLQLVVISINPLGETEGNDICKMPPLGSQRGLGWWGGWVGGWGGSACVVQDPGRRREGAPNQSLSTLGVVRITNGSSKTPRQPQERTELRQRGGETNKQRGGGSTAAR